jgi:hypothetical protein
MGGKKEKDIMAKDNALLRRTEQGTKVNPYPCLHDPMVGWIRDLFSTGPQS